MKEGNLMSVIEVKHLTKDYGKGRGLFDVSIKVEKGEVYGYLGPNGAGKSTTLRHLMGFIKADHGSVTINGMACRSEQKRLQQKVGYLPGEIALPEDMTGLGYLKLIGRMRKMTSTARRDALLTYFEMDPSPSIKRMSKGQKQKIAIVAAFMHEPEILLLDEPTSGLDPLMQKRFIDLVKEEKAKGTTVMLSSHIFEEVEKVCDRVGIIRAGKLVQELAIDEFRASQMKTFTVTYKDGREESHSLLDSEMDAFIKALAQKDIASLREEKHSLEEYFMTFYGGESNV